MTTQANSKSIRFGLLVGAIVLPVVLLLRVLGKPELDYPVLGASVAIAFAIRGRWELRSRWWFWVTAIVIVCLHVSLIVLIPWKAGWIPAPITTLAGLVDLAILFGIFGLVEKLMEGHRREEDVHQSS
jgi:hypothetical protein